MKILIIEPCQEGWGGWHRAFKFALGLHANGADVMLVCSAKAGERGGLETVRGARTLFLPRNKRRWFNGRIWRAIEAIRCIRMAKWDVIHFAELAQPESLVPFLYAKLFARKSELVVEWRDWLGGLDQSYDAYRVLPGTLILRWYRFVERHVHKLVRNMVAVSDLLEWRAKELGVKNVLKLWDAVWPCEYPLLNRDVARDKLRIPRDQYMLFQFGNSYHGKRKTLPIEYVARRAGVHLYTTYDVMSGCILKGWVVPGMEEARDRIHYVGHLEGEELGLYACAADALLLLMGDDPCERACLPVRLASYLNAEKRILCWPPRTEAWNLLEKYGAMDNASGSTRAKRDLTIRRQGLKLLAFYEGITGQA
jgi:hypothetical protein